jgi:hypothetical protein
MLVILSDRLARNPLVVAFRRLYAAVRASALIISVGGRTSGDITKRVAGSGRLSRHSATNRSNGTEHGDGSRSVARLSCSNGCLWVVRDHADVIWLRGAWTSRDDGSSNVFGEMDLLRNNISGPSHLLAVGRPGAVASTSGGGLLLIDLPQGFILNLVMFGLSEERLE